MPAGAGMSGSGPWLSYIPACTTAVEAVEGNSVSAQTSRVALVGLKFHRRFACDMCEDIIEYVAELEHVLVPTKVWFFWPILARSRRLATLLPQLRGVPGRSQAPLAGPAGAPLMPLLPLLWYFIHSCSLSFVMCYFIFDLIC